MIKNELHELTFNEMQEIDGGGWLSVVGGCLIAAGALVSGGGAVVVICGVAGGALTAIAGY